MINKTIKSITVIGAGRVGYPLALHLESMGFHVCVVDRDPSRVSQINLCQIGFYEPGLDELLETSKIAAFEPWNMPDTDAYIITVGTPVMDHGEPDVKQVTSAITSIGSAKLIKDKLLILRSTLAPGTMQYIKSFIQSRYNLSSFGDYYLTYCPERIAEGHALSELRTLPQIVGTEDWAVFELASQVFAQSVRCLHTTFEEAELAKLFSNTYRYINFAIPNYFQMMASQFGQDYSEIERVMMDGYPRLQNLASPGLVGGTCLRKDFAMLGEGGLGFTLADAAHQTNEAYAVWIADQAAKIGRYGKVGIFGLAFKANSDDLRDSLAIRVIRRLRRQGVSTIVCHEPNIQSSTVTLPGGDVLFNSSIEALNQCDVIVICAPHYDYKFTIREDCAIIDPWNDSNNLSIFKTIEQREQ